jgi:hypothetical protein
MTTDAGVSDWKSGKPVEEIDIRYNWQTCWEQVFNKQIDLIKEDIGRARKEDRLIIYLSCPISSRGGGYHGTNIDIARHTERRLLEAWGERFWILNPCQYQMESKEGTGLMYRHADELKIPREKLDGWPPPGGGDYMRMWTRVLCEDGYYFPEVKDPNCGRCFDVFYFLGPTDVQDFFTKDGVQTVTSGVEEYFARKSATDPDFCDFYTEPGIRWGPLPPGTPTGDPLQDDLRKKWKTKRQEFFRFYAVRASVNYSLGSHDEWNIFRLLNQRRLALTRAREMLDGDVGDQIAGYFDGRQIDPAAGQTPVVRGYAL